MNNFTQESQPAAQLDRYHPLTPLSKTSRCRSSRGKARNRHGEPKVKRPLWLTPTLWSLLEQRCAQYQQHFAGEPPISVSEYVERFLRQYLIDPQEFSPLEIAEDGAAADMPD